jgi:hypothetical protein
MKNKYFIIWVEGLTAKTGEKVKNFTNTGIEYTHLMTEALRVKQEDIPSVIDYIKRHGISDLGMGWESMFVETSHVPKGRLLDLEYKINLHNSTK